MPLHKEPCETLPQWLKDNLGDHCLAPLTGTDRRALMAAVQIVELYAVDSTSRVANAFGTIVARIQPRCWPLAYHAIAHVLDWDDRGLLWEEAGLPLIDAGKCKNE